MLPIKVVVFILVVWVLAFGIFVLPARPVGRRMARQGKGPISVILDIILCAVIALNVALLGWLALMVWGPDFFPHVKSDPMGFGMFFAAILLFVARLSCAVDGISESAKDR